MQKYLTVISAVLSDAKRNEIIEKNPARIIDLSDAGRKVQEIPTMGECRNSFLPSASLFSENSMDLQVS